jgi:hypothetical protein
MPNKTQPHTLKTVEQTELEKDKEACLSTFDLYLQVKYQGKTPLNNRHLNGEGQEYEFRLRGEH